MPVARRHARTRLIGEAAHAKLGRSQRLTREAPLHVNAPRADIAKLVEVLLRPVGHLETVAPTNRTAALRLGRRTRSRSGRTEARTPERPLAIAVREKRQLPNAST